MFENNIYKEQISPGFINSIITNSSLYDMFKNKFEENEEYFHKIPKSIYLEEILKYIENILITNDFLQENIIESIKNFYDDFLKPKFAKDESLIFKTKLFRNLKIIYFKENSNSSTLYEYIFNDIDYGSTLDKYINPLIKKITNNEKLSTNEFDLLLDFVKTNIEEALDMNLVKSLIKNHAYKKNHIFDRGVILEILNSISINYLKKYDIKPVIQTKNEIFESEMEDIWLLKEKIIKVNSILIDTFISGNYVELIIDLFYKLSLLQTMIILEKNEADYETYQVVLNLINQKVDLERIFIDKDYRPYNYFSDLKASSFLKTLRFYQDLGVDLMSNYINSKIKYVNFSVMSESISIKEHSLGVLASYRVLKMDKEKWSIYYKNIPVLKVFYYQNGVKKRTIDMIKEIKDEDIELLKAYLLSEISEPEIIIEDIMDLFEYKTDNLEISKLIHNLLTVIFVDTFYYSLNSHLTIYKTKAEFNRNEYLDYLLVKIHCLNETELTKDFIKVALSNINEAKQSS